MNAQLYAEIHETSSAIPVVVLTDVDQAFDLIAEHDMNVYFFDKGYEPDGNAWILPASDFTGAELAILLMKDVAELALGEVFDYSQEDQEYPDFPNQEWSGYQDRNFAYVLVSQEAVED